MRLEFRDPATPLQPHQLHLRWLVYTQITTKPETFGMGGWEVSPLRVSYQAGCKTTRCVGGWAQWYAEGEVDEDTVEQSAVSNMGLTYAEYFGLPPGTAAGSAAIWHDGLFYASEDAAVARMKVLADV